MLTASPRFRAYVDRAREGRTALWRILLGGLIIGIAWLALSSAAALPQLLSEQGSAGAFSAEAPADVALVLGSFAGIWVGVWLAVRLLQKRPLSGVLGSGGRIAWRDFLRAFVATLAASAVAEVAALAIDPSLQRSAIGLGEWLLWLGPLGVLVLVQVSAEELAFRGYLMQSLAARFRSPLVWALLPGLGFTLLHFDPVALSWMNASILISIAAFASAAAILVVATGNLGASMGMHLGLNLFGLLGASHVGWLSGVALLEGRPLNAGGWTVGEAASLALIGVANVALVLVLLLNARSPLRVASARGLRGRIGYEARPT